MKFPLLPRLCLPALFALVSAIGAEAQVVINEIHYKPADPTKSLEFIELYNPTAAAVNIGLWRIEDAVDTIFPSGATIPAGGYFVVAGNAAAFQTQFGFAPGAVFTGSLNSSGERIQLRDSASQLIDEVNYGVGFPWPTSARGGGFSMELINATLDNDLGASWRSSTTANGTPRAQNSVQIANPPPAIRQVEHTPVQPAGGATVTITAKISDPDGVGAVTLEYQVVSPGSYIKKGDPAFATGWVPLAMHDDGVNGDTLANEGIFSVQIPASVQVHRRLIRYRITLADTLGASVMVPYPDDEQPNFAYFVYNGVPAWSGALRPTAFSSFPATPAQTFPTTLLNSISPYHLIANAADVLNCQYNSAFLDREFLGTLVYDGVVYDHIQYRNRGIGSTYVSGKNKWAFVFNRGRDFHARDNWGRPYEPWNSFGMDANASPWAAVNRGSAGVEEALSYRIFELGGVPSLRTHYVHYRIIDDALETGPTQYDGDLWGLYLALEPTEGNFLDQRNLPDGNIYSIEGNAGDKKHQGATQPSTASDWTTFRDAVALAGQSEAFYRANEDLRNLYTFIGLSRLIGNVDVRPGDNHRYYHRPSDNRWVIMPYDLDMQFIAAHHWGGSIDGVVMAGVPNTIRAITRHPAIAIEFRNRCRELLSLVASDTSPSGGQIGQLVDEYAQIVNPAGVPLTWADLDAAMWNLHPRTAGSGTNTGQSSHKGNLWRAIYLDGTRGGLGGTVQTSSWVRQLADSNGDGFSDHEGLMQWFVNYATNTYPTTAPTWLRKAVTTGGGADPSTDRQKGYGYKYLEWESHYGGFASATTEPTVAPDLSYPAAPTISYVGSAGYPANGLDFSSSAFSRATAGGTTFAAMQWRIGEIYAPGIPGYAPGDQRIYELEDVWTSAELTSFNAITRVPLSFVKPGHTYRARVRHKDANGRWSRWSAPEQFIASAPSVVAFQEGLVVSEIMYSPPAPTAAELAQGWTEDDFEYIEVRNAGRVPIDMSGVRFTKGVDFDFPSNLTLEAGASTLVVRNVAAFNARYSSGKPIAGAWQSGDKLNDDGELIKLSYGAGTEILSFTYSAVAPWPVGAVGTGYSIVLRLPEINLGSFAHGNPPNWRLSRTAGGSPGTDDRPTFANWLAANGGSGGLLADDDGDGMVSLLEYAFAGNPTVNSQAPWPVASVQQFVFNGSPANFLTLTCKTQHGVEDIAYHVEFTTDLRGVWQENGVLVSATLGTDGIRTELWRASTPIGTTTTGFARIRVETQ